MSENVILAELKDVTNEIKHLAGVILTNTSTLKDISKDLSGSVKKQVYTMEDLAVRWNCSPRYARQIVSYFEIPLVRGKGGKPRCPNCVFKADLLNYEQCQSNKNLNCSSVSIAPAIGKTARGFTPYVKKKPIRFPEGARLGDLKKSKAAYDR